MYILIHVCIFHSTSYLCYDAVLFRWLCFGFVCFRSGFVSFCICLTVLHCILGLLCCAAIRGISLWICCISFWVPRHFMPHRLSILLYPTSTHGTGAHVNNSTLPSVQCTCIFHTYNVSYLLCLEPSKYISISL